MVSYRKFFETLHNYKFLHNDIPDESYLDCDVVLTCRFAKTIVHFDRTYIFKDGIISEQSDCYRNAGGMFPSFKKEDCIEYILSGDKKKLRADSRRCHIYDGDLNSVREEFAVWRGVNGERVQANVKSVIVQNTPYICPRTGSPWRMSDNEDGSGVISSRVFLFRQAKECDGCCLERDFIAWMMFRPFSEKSPRQVMIDKAKNSGSVFISSEMVEAIEDGYGYNRAFDCSSRDFLKRQIEEQHIIAKSILRQAKRRFAIKPLSRAEKTFFSMHLAASQMKALLK